MARFIVQCNRQPPALAPGFGPSRANGTAWPCLAAWLERFRMKQTTASTAILERIDAAAMLAQVQAWSAVNTGTANLAGLAQQASMLAEAFAVLPGKIELVDPAPVTAIDAAGREVERQHGQHMVLRVRPQANRRILLTGHMDTVFPADHPFQSTRWLEEGVLDRKSTR